MSHKSFLDDNLLLAPTTLAHLDNEFSTSLTDCREHLGMSQIGHDDDRYLWLQFRWAFLPGHDARVHRLFSLGNAIEREIIEWLRRYCDVITHDESGEQFRFAAVSGHFGGSIDGVIRNLIESDQWHVLECKSASRKKFAELIKTQSVERWNYQYYVQAQCYMAMTGLKRCYFVVYCKDDSSLYAERIKYRSSVWQQALERAQRIIAAAVPPASSWPNEMYYRSRWLSDQQRAVYWRKQMPVRSCRTCVYACPLVDNTNRPVGQWRCQLHCHALDANEQRRSCGDYQCIPDLVPETKGETQ